ncbi:hypothetical protein PIB30_001005 [Stylosanthes scabra]|uniref:Uncharacterized protein n=1 Tax=Stylosanthes scabra TaxID=79078 RepID=A0ABU6T267_9FABA|nr:hypothetical protein [Stylosanthes scabra]
MRERKRLRYHLFLFPFIIHFIVYYSHSFKKKRKQLCCSKKSTATIKKNKVRIRRSPPSQPSEEEAESAYPPLHFRGKPHKATTAIMVKGNRKSQNKGKAAQTSESPQKKDQGHAFKCVPLSMNVIFDKCINNDPQKKAIVEELGFGSL